jgi:hypothetical protein
MQISDAGLNLIKTAVWEAENSSTGKHTIFKKRPRCFEGG